MFVIGVCLCHSRCAGKNDGLPETAQGELLLRSVTVSRSPVLRSSAWQIREHLTELRHRKVHDHESPESDSLAADRRFDQAMTHTLVNAHHRREQAGGNHSSSGKELNGRSRIKSAPKPGDPGMAEQERHMSGPGRKINVREREKSLHRTDANQQKTDVKLVLNDHGSKRDTISRTLTFSQRKACRLLFRLFR